MNAYMEFGVNWPKVHIMSVFFFSPQAKEMTHSSNIANIPFSVPQDVIGKFNQE